ncbi:unnamed protein product [Rotaria sp. Silwood1]|nr:unnamed protein product [Rotaria sp. Silwood1]CAF1517294.1 unnamed protein product [Rotaria sp. Silwood1]CAF3586052.1 unnamed protein product [Rotaria sp. Silwood1]CAF4566275.1 unnamed protein product [Rotaria sp. Silwood1]
MFSFLLIIFIQIIICYSNCVYNIENGLKLDIRTLGYTNGKIPKYDQISNINPTRKTFSWNGCFSYSKSDNGNCTNAAACYTDSISNISIIIAKQDSVQFKYNYGSSILSYQYSNIHLTVFLICRVDGEDTTIGYQDDSTTYSIYIQSQCCCPGVIIFWILFIIIYLINRLIIRFIKNIKYFHHNLSFISNDKVCNQIFFISSNQYGSIKPIQTFNYSNNLFSNNEKINLTINPYSNIIDNSFQFQQSKSHLLKYYLKTYNPLQINLIDNHEQIIIRKKNIKDISYDEISNLTNRQIIDNCFSINCTNKQKIHDSKRYIRLKEQENCSATISIIDERSLQYNTKLTNTILPVVMITDCSNSQRLHTDIIEMNENE